MLTFTIFKLNPGRLTHRKKLLIGQPLEKSVFYRTG